MNATDVRVLIVDADRATRGLVMQMLRGFGMPDPAAVGTGLEAQAFLAGNGVDLCLCEATLPDMGCTELIHWIRHCGPAETRTIPVLVLTAQTQLRIVTDARDSGASIVVRKPLSARVLREHIDWAAKAERPFVKGGAYFGPDRRFRNMPIPQSEDRRGAAEEADSAADPNDIVREEIAAIEIILAARDGEHHGNHMRRRLLDHGLRIATYAGRAGYAHLEIAARGFCDAAAAADPRAPESMAPVTVHLQAIQLLMMGQGALTPRGADRILDELGNMARHLGLDARTPETVGEDDAPQTLRRGTR